MINERNCTLNTILTLTLPFILTLILNQTLIQTQILCLDADILLLFHG